MRQHTNNQVPLTHTQRGPSVGRQPATLDISVAEVKHVMIGLLWRLHTPVCVYVCVRVSDTGGSEKVYITFVLKAYEFHQNTCFY